MTMMKFHNALRIMRHVDRYELVSYGINLNDPQWFHFTSNPYDWFIRANDEDKTSLWRYIEDNMKGN